MVRDGVTGRGGHRLSLSDTNLNIKRRTADSEDVQCLLFEMSVIMMSFYGQEERKKEDSTKMTFTHIHCTQSSHFMFLPKPFERSG